MKFYLQYMEDDSYLLRLHNMDENSIQYLYADFSSCEQYTLTANQKWEQWQEKQMRWQEEGSRESPSLEAKPRQTVFPAADLRNLQDSADYAYYANKYRIFL